MGAMESAMDGRIVAINFWDLIPLAARAEVVNQFVQNRSRPSAPAPSGFRLIELIEQPLDVFPDVVRQRPECIRLSHC
jgi:hypothetical protein